MEAPDATPAMGYSSYPFDNPRASFVGGSSFPVERLSLDHDLDHSIAWKPPSTKRLFSVSGHVSAETRPSWMRARTSDSTNSAAALPRLKPSPPIQTKSVPMSRVLTVELSDRVVVSRISHLNLRQRQWPPKDEAIRFAHSNQLHAGVFTMRDSARALQIP